MEASFAYAVRQVPLNPPQLLGELSKCGITIGWQRRDGQLGQRGYEPGERRAFINQSPLRPPVKPEERIPAAIGGEVAGEHEAPVGRLLRVVDESEYPDLGMENVARAGPAHLVDDILEKCQQIGRPRPGIYGPGLAEDIEPVPHPSQGLHDFYGVQLIIEPKSREGERDHQGCREIEGERRRDRPIQGVARGWSQRVEQKLAAVRSEHGRPPDRGQCRPEASPPPATGN